MLAVENKHLLMLVQNCIIGNPDFKYVDRWKLYGQQCGGRSAPWNLIEDPHLQLGRLQGDSHLAIEFH